MKLLDLTLETPAQNLALDEALLNQAVAAELDGVDVLRFWESPTNAVIIGRGSRVDAEVDRDYCQNHGIPVLRRCSGGAAVVIGAGCLMYSVVLKSQGRDLLATVDGAHQLVLGRIRDAFQSIDLPVQISGTSDLTLQGRKFSGNSLRFKRGAVLYHGTLLYDGSISTICRCLHMPPRQPDYRDERGHGDFLVNLPAPQERIRAAIQQGWQCHEVLTVWPQAETLKLAAERYASDAWNLQR